MSRRPRPVPWGQILAASLVLPLAAACITRHPPADVRFFEPPALDWEDVRQEADPSAPGIQLQRVSAGAALGRPMVWRRSEVELAFDEQSRWVREPAALVEEALGTALFVQGPYRALEGRGAVRLEVRVTELEGRLGAQRHARVTLLAALAHPERPGTLTRRFTAEAPLAREHPEDLARAIGQALQAVALDVRAWLGEELERAAPES